MIHLYVEHLLNIKTLSIQASLATVSNTETKATLSADGSTLTLSHANETASIQLPINISPNQQSNIRLSIPAIPSKELSFRIQLEERPGVQSGLLSNGDGDGSNLVPWGADSLTAETQVCCANCSSIVIERGRIQAWKDLPSQGWAEMMEFWHCHKPHVPHTHAENELRKGYGFDSKLAIESGVGLVDIADFVFAPVDCADFKLLYCHPNSDTLMLHCPHCSALLGSRDPVTEANQLHKPYLAVRLHSDQIPVSHPMAKWLACRVLAAVESQGVRKFTIMSEGMNTAPLFKIWVLTPVLTVSSSAAPSSKPVRAMKVLWHIPDKAEKNESQMRKLLTESELTLDNHEAQGLLDTLGLTNEWIPEKARELQGWRVGLLERFITEDMAQWKADASIR